MDSSTTRQLHQSVHSPVFMGIDYLLSEKQAIDQEIKLGADPVEMNKRLDDWIRQARKTLEVITCES